MSNLSYVAKKGALSYSWRLRFSTFLVDKECRARTARAQRNFALDVGVVHPEVRSNMHREVFGFKCPSCGESLGAELPAKTMVITCTACGLDFAVKRPAKSKDEAAEVEERRLSQMNHWRQQRSRSIHKDEKGVVDAARVKERLQARQATVAALAPVKAKGEATAQQG